MNVQFKKGRKFGDWKLISYLGGGGNGEVWSCKNSNGDINAIKLLKKIKPKPYARFVDETTVIEQNSDIIGIIPIIDKYLPKKIGEHIPFFIMPIAESSEKLLIGKSINEKVDAILQVAESLKELHRRKIYHRDIKPANILHHNSRFGLADFGLAHYPNKKDISLKNEEIGAKWTMAPEMRRTSSNADVAKADIYSLAKTLWIFLTENKLGFDGQYSTESIIHLKRFYPQSYTSPIDNLLIACTDNDPQKRPSIKEFIYALQEWKDIEEDFHRKNQQQWFEIQTKLFPTSIPQRVIWEDINDIVKVLKVVCTYDNLNHLFFPDGGGLDLLDIRLSNEEGCIELDFQGVDIIKPKCLLFESFGYEYEWNYFRLEADNLNPSGVYENDEGDESDEREYEYEDVIETYPGCYEDSNYLEEMYYRGEENSEIYNKARRITRWFKGNFVIFCKRSTYNLTSSTYDGRHNKMNTDEFREYIQWNVDNFKKSENNRPLFERLFTEKANGKNKMRKNLLDFESWEE